jgi:hypothetical protein
VLLPARGFRRTSADGVPDTAELHAGTTSRDAEGSRSASGSRYASNSRRSAGSGCAEVADHAKVAGYAEVALKKKKPGHFDGSGPAGFDIVKSKRA